MDRHGRRFIAVPSLLIIALSYFALPMTESLVGRVVVATIMGIGNGFGNGVIMTLGADVAPAATRPEFLAAWRLFTTVDIPRSLDRWCCGPHSPTCFFGGGARRGICCWRRGHVSVHPTVCTVAETIDRIRSCQHLSAWTGPPDKERSEEVSITVSDSLAQVVWSD